MEEFTAMESAMSCTPASQRLGAEADSDKGGDSSSGPSSWAAPSTAKREMPAPPSRTPVKRPRRGSSCSWLVKEEEDGNEDEEDDDSEKTTAKVADAKSEGDGGGGGDPDSSQAGVGSADVSKHCFGCGRHCIHGKCFYCAGENVTWALPSCRGNWCRDCFTVWRTCLADEVPLFFLSNWLKIDTNAEKFEHNLIAFLTLCAERVPQIRLPHVQARSNVLLFLARLLGIELRPTRVVPLVMYFGTEGR